MVEIVLPSELRPEGVTVEPQPRDLGLVFVSLFIGQMVSLAGQRVAVDQLSAVDVLQEVPLPAKKLLVGEFPLVRVDLPKSLPKYKILHQDLTWPISSCVISC